MPRPARRKSSGLFSRSDFGLAYPEGIEDGYWYRARLAILRRWLGRVLPTPGPLLEIGCGRGYVVRALRGQGWNCWGVDLGRPRPASGAGPWLYLGRSAFTLPARQRQDMQGLLLLDVLEHIRDPGPFLARCGRNFPAAQGILLTLPACQELWSNYDEYYGHQRRYEPGVLAREAAQGGWKLARWGYAFHGLFPLLKLSLSLGLHRRVALRAPRWKAVDAWIAGAFSIEERVLPGTWPGTSLLAWLERF